MTEILSREKALQLQGDDGCGRKGCLPCSTFATIEALHDALVKVERARYDRSNMGRTQAVIAADAAVADLRKKGWMTEPEA